MTTTRRKQQPSHSIALPPILAHRGFSSRAPENTMSAFRLAAEQGILAVELDVHLTAGAELVVIHDYNLRRTTGCDLVVEKARYEEISRCDAGALFDSRFTGERVPLLIEVLDGLDERMFFDIEIKPPRPAGVGAGDELERLLVREIQARRLHDRCIVSSFNPLSIARVHRLDPAIHTALIFSGIAKGFGALARRQARRASRCTILKPHHGLVDAAWLERYQRGLGYGIAAWTVDDPAEARRLAGLGVEAIITNDPVAVREALQS